MRLLRSDDTGFSLQLTAYGGSLLLLLLAAIARRRADVDPELRRRREVYARQRKRIEAARSKPGREGLTDIAAALREARTAFGAPSNADLERLLHACDAVLYSPATEQSETTDAERIDLARRLLDQMAEKSE